MVYGTQIASYNYCYWGGWSIILITMVYDAKLTIVTGNNKPTNITGGATLYDSSIGMWPPQDNDAHVGQVSLVSAVSFTCSHCL